MGFAPAPYTTHRAAADPQAGCNNGNTSYNCMLTHMKHPNDGATRRELLGATLVLTSADAQAVNGLVSRNDRAIERALELQIADPANPDCGGIPGAFGLALPNGTAMALMDYVAGLLHQQSKFYGNSLVAQRIRLGIEHLRRGQNDDGFVDLLISNFDSPPDTAFVTSNLDTV